MIRLTILLALSVGVFAEQMTPEQQAAWDKAVAESDAIRARAPRETQPKAPTGRVSIEPGAETNESQKAGKEEEERRSAELAASAVKYYKEANAAASGGSMADLERNYPDTDWVKMSITAARRPVVLCGWATYNDLTDSMVVKSPSGNVIKFVKMLIPSEKLTVHIAKSYQPPKWRPIVFECTPRQDGVVILRKIFSAESGEVIK